MKNTLQKNLNVVKSTLLLKGWCRGTNTDSRGRHCLNGAIGNSGLSWPAQDKVRIALKKQIDLEQGVGRESIIGYNDGIAKDSRYIFRLIERTARDQK